MADIVQDYKKNVWMPPLHTEHKESMLYQTKGVSICPPIHLDAPVCLDAAICLNVSPGMFGCPICLDIPIYLDATCTFGHPPCLHSPYVWVPPMFGHPYLWSDAPHVWTPPCMSGCPSYVSLSPVHTQHKENMFCQNEGVSICPIHLDVPTCLDAPCMFGCHQLYGGIQT